MVCLLALLIALRVAAPDQVRLQNAIRLLPDLLRLVHRLARDSTLPKGVRIRLGLLRVYLASPVDLVPDFIPVIGFADDAIIVALVLRSVIKHAGLPAVVQHWPGTAEGLSVLLQVCRVKPHWPIAQRLIHEGSDTPVRTTCFDY